MNLTPTEIDALWSVAGKAGACLAAVVAFIKAVRYLFSLSPTSRLEIRVKRCEENLQKDFSHLERIDGEITEIKKSQQQYGDELHKAVKGINKIGTSQISLLRHMTDGNGVDEMRAEADDLTKFFIES